MRIERFEKGILERSLSWFKMMSFGEDLVMVASAGMMPSLGSWLTLPGKFVWPHTVALDLNTVALDSPHPMYESCNTGLCYMDNRSSPGWVGGVLRCSRVDWH